ncbi:hypothetical protein V1291_001896 [Nitrobacteraceae bacterium AZCC 1564]
MGHKLFMITFAAASIVALCGWLMGLGWAATKLIGLL